MSSRVERIAVCGGGLAAQMAVTALSRQLPPGMRLIWVRTPPPATDLFYGTLTPPSAYDFNLSLGVSEPSVVLNSPTAFSYGTGFVRWGDRSWAQVYQQPFRILDGVLFHQYLPSQNVTSLEPFLVAAVAAREGRFAHPPETGTSPLAKAAYGYHIDPMTYGDVFAEAADATRIDIVDARIERVQHTGGRIVALHLSDGRELGADFFVDATGPEAKLLSVLGGTFEPAQTLRGVLSLIPEGRLGPAARLLGAHPFGWLAEASLKGALARLTVFDAADEAAALAAHGVSAGVSAEITTGRRDEAWRGNCVAIGHAAAVMDPVTPAPLMLLEQDIDRLMSLLPCSDDMTVESGDYNRRGRNNYASAALFSRALFELGSLPKGRYWTHARQGAPDERLTRKIEQFVSRGLHVAYDNELFHQEDWIILHYGMGRVPQRHDRMADRAPAAQVQKFLSHTQQSIDATVKSMPPHDTYMKGLCRYLSQQKD